MDDKNPRLDAERITGRREDQVGGRGTEDAWQSSDRVSPPKSTPARDLYTTPSVSTSTAVKPAEPGVPPAPRNFPVTQPGSVQWREAGEEAAETPDNRTSQIKAEIEQTKGEISETVNAIQDRLRPGTIASNTAESVKQVASDTVGGIADSEPVQYIRANPIASTMVAIGVGGLTWVAFGSRRNTSRYPRYRRDWKQTRDRKVAVDSYHRNGQLAYDARPEYAAGDPNDATAGWSKAVARTAEDLHERTRQTTRTARSRVLRSWNTNPLLLGAMTLVLGAIVGAAVPESDRENEWLGETRDNLIDDVQQSVKQTVQKVQNAASDAVGLTSE
jgi:hypothetical protein